MFDVQLHVLATKQAVVFAHGNDNKSFRDRNAFVMGTEDRDGKSYGKTCWLSTKPGRVLLVSEGRNDFFSG